MQLNGSAKNTMLAQAKLNECKSLCVGMSLRSFGKRISFRQSSRILLTALPKKITRPIYIPL